MFEPYRLLCAGRGLKETPPSDRGRFNPMMRCFWLIAGETVGRWRAGGELVSPGHLCRCLLDQGGQGKTHRGR